MHHFCTYFDSGYLVRGLALYESLRKHVPQFRLYVLCLDDEVFRFLSRERREGVVPVSLRELEAADRELASCKSSRGKFEYYFTCSPAFTLYVMERFGLPMVSYLDADLYFFSSPDPLFEELGDDSILIIGHRFSPQNRHLEQYGRYNVGFLCFRNDGEGRNCLSWWRQKCIEWCYDRVEGERFADQKYLDSWPQRFAKVCDLRHKGANLAPWNIDSFRFSKVNGELLVDGEQLIFFHFHGFNAVSRVLFEVGTKRYGSRLCRELITCVYGRYVEAIREATGGVQGSLGHDRRHSNPESLAALILMVASEEVICCCPGLPRFSLSQALDPVFAGLRRIRQGVLKAQ